MKNLSSNRPFVYDNEKIFTYKDLKIFCKCLENIYKARNVNKVLVCLTQSFEAYAVVICSFLTGVTFCSIRADDPLNRKAFYLDRFQPDMVISDEANNISEIVNSDKVVLLNSLRSYKNYTLAENDISYFVEQDIAYVMFTSGTTGFPKGVMLKRVALLHVVDWMDKTFKLQNTDICSQYSNMSFDMSLIDIFVAVTAGAALVPFPSFQDKLFPGFKINKYGITFWHSVPNVIDILYSQNQLVQEVVGTIKKCKFGGEQIYEVQLEHFYEALPEVTTFLTYGTTEITCICTYIEVNKNNYFMYSKKNMALGIPIDGWNIILENVNQGVGEIIVYGDFIGAGYIDDQLKNMRFKKIMINGKYENAYFTGDLGQYIDNVLYYNGRRDFQVKINGNRIDLSEIDRVMREIDSCIASYTLFYKDKLIVAYIGDNLDEATIRMTLTIELPKIYMPHLVICRTYLPKNNSGKIDRNELINELIGEGKIQH